MSVRPFVRPCGVFVNSPLALSNEVLLEDAPRCILHDHVNHRMENCRPPLITFREYVFQWGSWSGWFVMRQQSSSYSTSSSSSSWIADEFFRNTLKQGNRSSNEQINYLDCHLQFCVKLHH